MGYASPDFYQNRSQVLFITNIKKMHNNISHVTKTEGTNSSIVVLSWGQVSPKQAIILTSADIIHIFTHKKGL
jgi:hypothetical protein